MGETTPYSPLFESRTAKYRSLFKLYLSTILIGIFLIIFYRFKFFPEQKLEETCAWMGLLLSEIWFSLYWLITQSVRWKPIYRHTFKDRLAQRYERDLPGLDVFVCTADPVIEPPLIVVNTTLSVMAYNYPPEKLAIYVSDDGGAEVTFYALLEASRFSKMWLPFCRKFNVEPRSPEAYFRSVHHAPYESSKYQEWSTMKKSYEEMKRRIETTTKLGQVSEEIRKEHKGFFEWNLVSSKRDHQTILQILIDGRNPMSLDGEGQTLPTLVYLSREKRPQHHHQFKAGALNALIRVSSRISNGPIILNVDCDMYSNNSDSARDALCFFMDEKQGHEIAYVQFPQSFDNITKNDLYSSSFRVIMKVELAGFDCNGGPPYIGTGCFHRRETLYGKKRSKDHEMELKQEKRKSTEEDVNILEETCKVLASCTYEDNTQWGKEMGIKYGCLVEDIATGLVIQCRGWKSIYYNPERKGFLGVAPTTLLQSLVQHKRWAEGQFQVFLSSYCPFIYGHGKIPLKLQLSYCTYMLWAVNCLSTLYYVTIPSLCLIKGISLFPKLSSLWVIPFLYVILATQLYSIIEYVLCGVTLRGWWNDLRMWLFKRTTCYLYGFIDNILRILGFTNSAFGITAKVTDEDVSNRYEKEIMEFGATSPMFTILATLALINMCCFIKGIIAVIMKGQYFEQYALQIMLSTLLVTLNIPIYEGLFLRKDKGGMPFSVTCKSIIYALILYSIVQT